MHRYAAALREKLMLVATPERRQSSAAYLRNQFACIGVDTTTRRMILKDFVAERGKPSYPHLPALIKEMWEMEREMQLCAVELGSLYKKEWTENFITVIEYCITKDSWWDSVDHIATEWTGPYFRLFPATVKSVTGKWNRSRNIWLQRSSIMFQKQYRKQTDTQLLSKYILHCASSKEFFIQKAIGWALREFGKTDADWVRNFVKEKTLQPLSKREALRNIGDNG